MAFDLLTVVIWAVRPVIAKQKCSGLTRERMYLLIASQLDETVPYLLKKYMKGLSYTKVQSLALEEHCITRLRL